MIYKCEDCVNNTGCCENQKEYKLLCQAADAISRGFHCWFSLKLKCDYYNEIPSLHETESSCQG